MYRALRCLLISWIVCSCLTLLEGSGTGAGDWITFTSIDLQRDQEQAIGQLSNSSQGRLLTLYCENRLSRRIHLHSSRRCITRCPNPFHVTHDINRLEASGSLICIHFKYERGAALSNAWTVFTRSNTGVVGSNPTQGMDVCVRFFYVCVCSVDR
jgi:hypothetical protein